MKNYLFAICFFILLVFCGPSKTSESYNTEEIEKTKKHTLVEGGRYNLVWNDEFNYDNYLDSNKWAFDVGGHGWGNNELQYYTNGQNIYVQNGVLKIVAKREMYQTREGYWNYTSARLVSRASFKYGYFEIGARLPYGMGSWPAIWMLPTAYKYGPWPSSGEIDIMEHVGHTPGVVYGSAHTESYNHKIGTQKNSNIRVRDPNTYFYRYGVKWTPDKIEWFVNDVKYFEFTNEGKGYKTWPFDDAFHLLLNVAVGGSWGGRVDDSAFPMAMDIDYVRVYQEIQ